MNVRPSLYQISLEIRLAIFRLVLPAGERIHVFPERSDLRNSGWVFSRCFEGEFNDHLKCACKAEENDRLVDTALLSVSKQLQSEALTVLFSCNTIVLLVISELRDRWFNTDFDGYLSLIKTMALQAVLTDRQLASMQHQTKGSPFTSLQELNIECFLEKSGVYEDFWMDGALNCFRVFGHTPLKKACVTFSDYTSLDSTVQSEFKQKAEAILLRDPNYRLSHCRSE